MPWRPGLISGRLSPSMRVPVLNRAAYGDQPEEKKKNDSPSPANIEAASGYYKVIVPGELKNEVQTQIGGISTD